MKRAARLRGWIQAAAALAFNPHIGNLKGGGIYRGALKSGCVPVLNCYSCPASTGACPIGALQAVATGRKHSLSFYALGSLMLFGLLVGRLICGFLCPFGWMQDLLHKIPLPKPRVPKRADRWLRGLKYALLALFVLVLPAAVQNAFGLGEPWFCKWICPAGTLEGGIPMVMQNPTLRASLGFLFSWKMGVLIAVIALSTLLQRPFCKYLCPLGAFYSLFNRVSFFKLKVEESRCVDCGLCARACPMQVDVLKNINSGECIRCGRCAAVCPQDAIHAETPLQARAKGT